jgi:hypothetical protein
VLELAFANNGKNYLFKGSMHKAWGLADGSAFIEGNFSNLPVWVLRQAHVTGIQLTGVAYKDEGKARREGLEHPERPWVHDFSSATVRAYRVKGGLLIKGACPVWEMR